jgi:hypothetical protein
LGLKHCAPPRDAIHGIELAQLRRNFTYLKAPSFGRIAHTASIGISLRHICQLTDILVITEERYFPEISSMLLMSLIIHLSDPLRMSSRRATTGSEDNCTSNGNPQQRPNASL